MVYTLMSSNHTDDKYLLIAYAMMANEASRMCVFVCACDNHNMFVNVMLCNNHESVDSRVSVAQPKQSFEIMKYR